MDTLFNEILSSNSAELSVAACAAAMAASLLLGIVIAFTYRRTQDGEYYQQSLAVTLCMLPIILAVIILFVGSNIARAFSMAGTLSIIRFRSAPGDAKDIGFIFFAVAAGLACGVGLYGYGALFVLVLCAVLIAFAKTNAFSRDHAERHLMIIIPENLSFGHAFDDIFERYTQKHKLTRIKTTDLGSLFEVDYTVTLKQGCNEQEFINELRCRNGNLNIVLSAAPAVTK